MTPSEQEDQDLLRLLETLKPTMDAEKFSAIADYCKRVPIAFVSTEPKSFKDQD
jgi:hypothetical protein